MNCHAHSSISTRCCQPLHYKSLYFSCFYLLFAKPCGERIVSVLLKAENILTWRNQGYFYFYVIAQSLMLTLTHNNIYNKYPLKPHSYIVKLGFAGEYLCSLFLIKNIDCGYSLEPPHRSTHNQCFEQK